MIKSCSFCRKHSGAVKDYLEQYLTFDGAVDNDIDADDDILDHMDSHLKELAASARKHDKYKRLLVKTLLS